MRGETTPVLDVCGGCRRCTDVCGVFPSLFELLDDGRIGGDPGEMTPAEQDRIVDGCVQS